jgi:subfamily B ATP-binding cassette protein HlyB/CyaB
VVVLARFFGLPADAEQLKHEFGQAGKLFGESEILLAARHLGLKASAADSDWPRLSVISLPAIAVQKDGRHVLLARADNEKVLVQDPGEPKPLILPRQVFEEAWSGRLILFTKRAHLRPEDRKFDFTWFIPAIVKYRKLLGEVLLASFFIQLFALLTPLFFQVVIDKVLVHKALTTLTVLGIGMLALVLFEAILTGLRMYVFAHTSSRIDVGLGAQLFKHLLRLPLAYFEARRVGDTVARVRELETIRQFLTSSTVTVVIDLFFTIVFLAVMYFYSPLLTFVVLATIPYIYHSLGSRDPYLPRALKREIQPRRGQSGLPGRIHQRGGNPQGHGGGTRHAAPLGRAARGLCSRQFSRHQPWQHCWPDGFFCEQSDYRGDSLDRRLPSHGRLVNHRPVDCL